MDPMILLRDLEFRYGDDDFTLRIDALHVERSTSVALIGPSGSGKTTLLNLIAGILLPERGRIETDGVCVNELADAERRIFRIRRLGLVFQEFELLGYLSVMDNLLLPYRINPVLELDDAVRERAIGLARRVGIADHLDRFPDRLSQGERQRAAVCRAVLPRPALVLADEPTGNLDPGNKSRVLEILFEFVDETDATLVTVTHDRDLLSRFDRVVDFESFRAPATPR